MKRMYDFDFAYGRLKDTIIFVNNIPTYVEDVFLEDDGDIFLRCYNTEDEHFIVNHENDSVSMKGPVVGWYKMGDKLSLAYKTGERQWKCGTRMHPSVSKYILDYISPKEAEEENIRVLHPNWVIVGSRVYYKVFDAGVVIGSTIYITDSKLDAIFKMDFKGEQHA